MTTPARMPALFVGHGNPMNAIEDNRWSRALQALAADLPTPRAILAVSAHWYVDGLLATGAERPETIHDFGGFPDALYRVQYPAPGDPALARRVVGLLGTRRASVTGSWGLDHGTWTVLRYLRPGADVPVVQLSLDAGLTPAEHLAAGRALAPLRDDGVLLLGSGNLTHDLRHAFGAWHRGETATPAWAAAFDEAAARAVAGRDEAWLAGALAREEGRRAHPTPDHFLPVLYVAGAARPEEPVTSPITGFDMSSLSMRTIRVG
ncbi:MAG TPA: 4,5-DOPA dioxygenase extradiol [Anaeromyxobacteraceae bacterium]|nr:4,5-DOPA dioxygenase extradiol [Anaeromyxobacteraceae bacterium]